MHRLALLPLLFAVALACGTARAASGEFRIGSNDSAETVLTAQKGKRVTVRLRSGQELTGIVREITGRLVQLDALAGKDFYDAVVPLEAVEAIIVRTKE